MTTYIPLLIDNGLQFLIAIFFLYQYFNENNQRTYKKKWIPPLVIFLIVASSLLAYNDIREMKQKERNNRMPSPEETRTAFENKALFALNEKIYDSEDGYTIIIPEGYTYLPVKDGSLSFAAVKKTSKERFAITVARHQSSGYIHKTVAKLIEQFQAKYQNFNHTVTGKGNSRTITFMFDDNNGRNNGSVLVTKRGQFFFIVSAVAKNVPEEAGNTLEELDRIIKSFTFK